MNDSIYLAGSEDVRIASHEMTQAAAEMKMAARDIHDALFLSLDQFREQVSVLADLTEREEG